MKLFEQLLNVTYILSQSTFITYSMYVAITHTM